MKQLNLKLEQTHKSFDKNFQTTLIGDLIILSGINGSGKSQLMSIFKGMFKHKEDTRYEQHGLTPIQRQLLINNENIEPDEIMLLNYKDNIKVPEILNPVPSKVTEAIDNGYNYFKNLNNNTNYGQGHPFYSSNKRAYKAIIDKFGEDAVNKSEAEIKQALSEANIFWINENEFSDFIGAIFYNHALSILEGERKIGQTGGNAFDKLSLGKAPWTELNELFEKLNFEYRFKNHYEIVKFNLNEVPSIYSIDDSKKIIESEKRELNDLSDGEKTIISLCFNALRGIEKEDKKILLLDEIDAVLNPSLIKSLFIMIDEYFIKKGILVILSSHSSATLSLAPDYCTFYEVFKKNNSGTRIIKTSQEEYSELKLVNQKFYDKINDQENRIKELTENNNGKNSRFLELEKKIKELTKPVLITEGITDKAIFDNAWSKLYNIECPFDIVPADTRRDNIGGNGGASVLSHFANAVRPNESIKIVFWDYDTDGIKGFKLNNNFNLYNETNWIKRHNNGRSFGIIIPFYEDLKDFHDAQNLPIEYLFRKEDLNKKDESGKGIELKPVVVKIKFGNKEIETVISDESVYKIDGDKKAFAFNIVPTLPKESFEKFDKIFQQILEIIKT